MRLYAQILQTAGSVSEQLLQGILQLTSMNICTSLIPHPPFVFNAVVPIVISKFKSVWSKMTSTFNATSSPGLPPRSQALRPPFTSDEVVIPVVAEE